VDAGSLTKNRPLLDVLASTSVHQRVSRLSGYELSRSGESRVAA